MQRARPTTLLRIERMAPEGQALGRAAASGQSGKVVFVPYGAPGDVLEAELTAQKEGYASGRLVRVQEPGPGRVQAPCPYHFQPGSPGAWCGGCDWQQLSAPAQLEAKRSLIQDCLKRIARLPDAPVAPVIASPELWRYRNKVQVPFGVKDGRVAAGFYAPGSHEIVDFADCLVQPELSVRIVLKVKALAAEWRWPVYDERLNRGWLRHLLVRTSKDGKAHATLVTRTPEFRQEGRFIAALREAFPTLAGLFQNVQPLKSSVVLGPGWRKLWGSPMLEERVGRLRLSSSPGAFLQVNTPASEKLYEAVSRQLQEGGFTPELLADLYCGVGSIALWVAAAARRVVGVEESRDAVSDAWFNARANGVTNARFLAGRAEALLGRLRTELDRAAPGSSAAVLDPPRTGAAPPVLRALEAPAIRRVIYVSCNPATFARDAVSLSRSGFSLMDVQPVDLFPQTSHIELSARFDRK
ncbi:MAG: 23S rRNA (uracil(1939)-C(5))-methyltransferase RlmD [Elusimicrobia bacterium]|nr:23S rRNA (uracil(1939)-C(5))-methyltransferase RlmD [Elusimicrobiota bacterium]